MDSITTTSGDRSEFRETPSGFAKVDRLIAHHFGLPVALLWSELCFWWDRASEEGKPWAFRNQEELRVWALVSRDQQLPARRKLVELGWIEERLGHKRRFEFRTDESACKRWRESVLTDRSAESSDPDSRRLSRSSDTETRSLNGSSDTDFRRLNESSESSAPDFRRLSDPETRRLNGSSDPETRRLSKEHDLRSTSKEHEPPNPPKGSKSESGSASPTRESFPDKQLREWFDFWFQDYPNQSRPEEAWKAFQKLAKAEGITPEKMHQLQISVALWKVSDQWQEERYIPRAENFLGKGIWKERPPTYAGVA